MNLNMMNGKMDFNQHMGRVQGIPNVLKFKSQILFTQGNRKMELKELIKENQLPYYILGEYSHKYMINTQKVRFELITP